MLNKKYFKNLVAASVIGTVLLTQTKPIYALDNLNQKLEEKQQNHTNISDKMSADQEQIYKYESSIQQSQAKKVDVEAELNKLQTQKASLEEQINFINSNIQTTVNEIYQLDSQVLDIKNKISKKQLEIEKTKSSIKTNSELLAKRIVVMYKMGEASKIEILLSSEDINDFLSRNKLMTTITKHDKELIAKLKEDRNKLETLVIELNGQKKSLEISLQNAEAKKRELENQKQIQNQLLEQIRANEASKYEKLKNIANEINSYQQNLDKKISERSGLEEKQSKIQAEIDELKREIAAEEERIREERASASRLEEQKKELESKENELSEVEDKVATSVRKGGKLAWPTSATWVTYTFGWRIAPIGDSVPQWHRGVDIVGDYGDDIYAAEAGVVTFAGWNNGGYGNLVIIDHGNGMETYYAHFDSISVRTGQRVSRGQYLGAMGSTGYSNAPHLHFEVRFGGQEVDPLPYIR